MFPFNQKFTLNTFKMIIIIIFIMYNEYFQGLNQKSLCRHFLVHIYCKVSLISFIILTPKGSILQEKIFKWILFALKINKFSKLAIMTFNTAEDLHYKYEYILTVYLISRAFLIYKSNVVYLFVGLWVNYIPQLVPS